MFIKTVLVLCFSCNVTLRFLVLQFRSTVPPLAWDASKCLKWMRVLGLLHCSLDQRCVWGTAPHLKISITFASNVKDEKNCACYVCRKLLEQYASFLVLKGPANYSWVVLEYSLWNTSTLALYFHNCLVRRCRNRTSSYSNCYSTEDSIECSSWRWLLIVMIWLWWVPSPLTSRFELINRVRLPTSFSYRYDGYWLPSQAKYIMGSLVLQTTEIILSFPICTSRLKSLLTFLSLLKEYYRLDTLHLPF